MRGHIVPMESWLPRLPLPVHKQPSCHGLRICFPVSYTISVDTRMQPLGLLALGLLAAQAYKITMFAGLDCTGESHAETDPTKACKTPLGLPAEFDARSIKVEDTPLDCQIWMFTDKSLRCDSYQDNTWRFWTKVNEGGCRP